MLRFNVCLLLIYELPTVVVEFFGEVRRFIMVGLLRYTVTIDFFVYPVSIVTEGGNNINFSWLKIRLS